MRQGYAPLDAPKQVADDVWIVDGPSIRFGGFGLKIPFPTRMTLVRLPGDRLFVHSPTELTPQLRQAVERIGEPLWLVAPNRIHYWWLPDWHRAFPGAQPWLAPRVREQAGARIDFEAMLLEGAGGYPWDDAIAGLPVAGRYMTEFVFFHRASRTLLLADLIENFEARTLDGWWMPLLVRLGGALDPHGSMPRDMRLTYPREVLRAALATMLSWEPERVVLAHGRWYERDGAAELERAFAWLD